MLHCVDCRDAESYATAAAKLAKQQLITYANV